MSQVNLDLLKLIAVGFFWGVTNPLIKIGSKGIENVHGRNKIEQTYKEILFLATNLKYLVPFMINQLGSILYLFTLPNVDLSVAVPVTNSLAFVFTGIVGWALNEEQPNKNSLLGMSVVSLEIRIKMGHNKKFEENEVLKPGEFIKNGKKYIRIVTHDSVRDLIVPSPSANMNSAVYCSDELKELAEKKKLGTEQVLQATESLSKQKEDEARKAALRRKSLQSYPIYKEYGPRLNKLEQEAEAKANFLLNRAKEIKEEDDDQIKLCNKLILSTKCHAIRDAQIAEKNTISKEMKDEEKRLDAMMEQERKKMIAKETLDKSNDGEKREAYKKAITEQVQGKILEREMEAERLIEESKILSEAAVQGQIDELRELQKKAEEKKKMREELNRINQTMIEKSERERNQAKLADLKIQEFMRQKAEMEEKREKDLLMLRAEREMELAKLRKQQQKLQDREAEKDAVRAKRMMDQVEREWREKEKFFKTEKQRKIEQLKAEREKQIEEKKRAQAIEAERQRQDNVRLQLLEREIEKREQEEEEKKKQNLLSYKASLLKQINEKEYERIQQKKAVFEEGLSASIERRNHEEFLKSIVKKKLNAIRANNVPEKYIEDIEKRLKL